MEVQRDRCTNDIVLIDVCSAGVDICEVIMHLHL